MYKVNILQLVWSSRSAMTNGFIAGAVAWLLEMYSWLSLLVLAYSGACAEAVVQPV